MLRELGGDGNMSMWAKSAIGEANPQATGRMRPGLLALAAACLFGVGGQHLKAGSSAPAFNEYRFDGTISRGVLEN